MARVAELHADWLRLVEPVDPFLTLPVLNRVFPEGLDRVSTEARVEMRARLAPLNGDRATQTIWIEWVLGDLLGHGGFVVSGPALPDSLALPVPEHRTVLRPEWAVVGPTPESKEAVPRLLISRYRTGTAFDQPIDGERWTATPVDRMTMLCRATGVELGILTDGRVWQLLWARPNEPVGHGTWDATYFSEERAHLDSFVSILGAKRMYAVPPPDTVEALLAESSDRQEAVTRQLGDQVRAATELLVAAISRANRERSGGLLKGVDSRTVYEAAVTVMMRLVFLLYAEERQLLPLNDETYDRSYAVSTMLHALEEESDTIGEEPLERRSTAWHRLLATFRAVHGGVQHEDLRIPAYGGRLFDPDRFEFLEGRTAGEQWREMNRDPLPIDDLTVMAMLRALQVLEFREAGVRDVRQLSFGALDVEQIGHVYEGLLDHSAVATDEIVLGLRGRRSKERTSEPEIPLPDIETAAARGHDALVSWLREATGLTQAQIVKALDSGLDADLTRRLLEACENDRVAFERVAPYAHLLRVDLRGLPVVFLDGSTYVTEVSLRSDTGTQYTTRELADEVARYTLEPLVYNPGPAEGADRGTWQLRGSDEILALRVCDPAVGSGAILVAACRYLSDRVAEAWIDEGVAFEQAGSGEADDVVLAARRAVAGRCLYGVDRDPMAAEMAKLSLWLVTMAKERPFTFLDHAIQVGDSLLGITDLDQIRHFHMDPAVGRELHSTLFDYTAALESVVSDASSMRDELESIDVVTLRDADDRARLHQKVKALTARLELVGDVLVGAALSASASAEVSLDDRLTSVAPLISGLLPSDGGVSTDSPSILEAKAETWLEAGRPDTAPRRRCLHWPLAFPEIFSTRGGFDAIVGNPPFLGGTKISGPNGVDFRHHIAKWIAGFATDRADLCSFFFLRAGSLTGPRSAIGLLATQAIRDGSSRVVALDGLIDRGFRIGRAVRNKPWPGSAAVHISQVWLFRGMPAVAPWLDGEPASEIGAALEIPGRVVGDPQALPSPGAIALQGAKPNFKGFVLSPDTAAGLLADDPKNSEVVRPYLVGRDLNGSPSAEATRLIIDFRDWTRERAESFTAPFSHVESRLPGERETVKGDISTPFWCFGRPGMALRRAIEPLERVIAVAYTSSTLGFRFISPRQTIGDAVVVIASDDAAMLAVLSSSIHYWWVVKHGTALKSDLRYQPSRVFNTFVFPPHSSRLEAAGEEFSAARQRVMDANDWGLTALGERLHDPAKTGEDLEGLRGLIERIDALVSAAYGWDDLDLSHGFRETGYGVRWTIGPEAQTEILDRLLELNHQACAATASPEHQREAPKMSAVQADGSEGGPQLMIDLGGEESE